MIEFRVLGSLEVVHHGCPLVLGAPGQRALLAVLLIHRGEPVSADRLIDALWGEQPPTSAHKIVQGYVSKLRKALGAERLVTRGRAYALQVESGELDVDRYQALIGASRRAAEQGDARMAVAQLREALALWRGPPLADFAYQSFAQGEIARLEELRLAALEERIAAELTLGDAAGVVAELEGLVREHPLREGFTAQLMLALYRTGRQAEALDAYQHARARLGGELGLEPSPQLRTPQVQILEQAVASPPSQDLRRTLSPGSALARPESRSTVFRIRRRR